MKGHHVPAHPAIRAFIDKLGPLTLDDIRLVIERSSHTGVVTMHAGPIEFERMPEPSPYERGVLDRYQDGRRR